MSKNTFRVIIASVLLVVFIFMAFLMCSNPTTTDAKSYVSFTVIGRCPLMFDLVYDNETGVMYVMSTHPDNMGSMTVMVNPDGTPRVYEGFSKP